MPSQGAEEWVEEGAWIGSVGFLAGFAGLYFGSMVLFRWGVPMSPWHGFLFAGPALGVCLGSKPDRSGWAIWLGLLLVTAVATALAVPFHDFSWDGMGARQGMVEAIVQGSTPRASPTPHVLSAWIACLTGQINAGKAVNLLAAVAAFGSLLRFLRALRLPREWSWVGAATAALNPVLVYQLSSYYIDGFTGSLLACLVGAYGLVYLSPGDIRRWLFMALVLALVAPAKVSGLAYSVILGAGFFIALLTKQGWTLPKLLRLGTALTALTLLVFLSHLMERGSTYRWDKLVRSTDLKTPDFGVGGASGAPSEAAQMNKAEAFFRSHFAPTRTMSLAWGWKFPFWLNRPELSLFEDLNSDPRSGGFGPFYGGVFLLAAGAALACLVSGAPRLPWVAWLPAGFLLASCLLSQAWWARWVPQAWLVPLALAVPALAGPSPRLAGILARSALTLALLNSVLILAFYSSGCWQNESLLRSQLRFLQSIVPPVQIHIPTFPSNQTWLKDVGIQHEILAQEPPRPRMILQRTDSKVALAKAWPADELPAEDLREWRRRKLIEE